MNRIYFCSHCKMSFPKDFKEHEEIFFPDNNEGVIFRNCRGTLQPCFTAHDLIVELDRRIEKYKVRTMFENSPDLIAYKELESLKEKIGEGE